MCKFIVLHCKLLFLLLGICVSHSYNEYRDAYLKNQQEYANMELIKSSMAQTALENNRDFKADVILHNSTIVSLYSNYSSANVFSILNEIYVVFDFDFYHITIHNQVLNIRRALFLTTNERILFVKVAEYDNLEILYVPYESGVSDIYARNKSTEKWDLIQSIQSEKNISDAIMFISNSSLYLCIANSFSLSAISSFSVYKWTGAYFDEIDRVHTRNPSNVFTFHNQYSYFVTFLENSLDIKSQRNLVIYELTENRLEKVQTMRISNLGRMISYAIKDIQYVVVFSEDQNSTLYQWHDSELIPLNTFGCYKNIDKIFVAMISDVPVIFVTQKANLLIFIQFASEIRLIHESNIFSQYKRIFDMRVMQDYIGNLLLVFVQSCDNKVGHITIPFIIKFSGIDSTFQTSNELLKCFGELNELTKFLIDNLPEEPENKTTMGIITEAKISQEQPKIKISRSIQSKHNYSEQASQIITYISDFHRRLDKLNSKIDLLYQKGSSLNGKTIIRGGIYADELIVKNLQVKYINNKLWAPHTWLFYTKPQTITGPVYIDTIITKNIEIGEDNIINNMLLNAGDQRISGKLILKKLTADTINTLTINDINLEDIYLKNRKGIIKGVKSINNATVDKILHSEKYPSKFFHSGISSNLKFFGNLSVTNLNVESINDINWEGFQKNVFRLGVDDTIAGNITITNATRAVKLFANKLSNIDSKTLLTTSTNQTIMSNMRFSNIIVSNLRCQNINDIRMTEIVTSKNSVVKGSVTIGNLRIENLYMNSPMDDMPSRDHHIVGTSESDLMQIYNKNVKIKGNLHLSNILIARRGKVNVDNKPFKIEDVNQYWLKNHPQVIPVQIKALNGISTSHLTVISLNHVVLDNYLMNTLDDKMATYVIFENITIGGNVFLNRSLLHTPNLPMLNSEAVKTSGSFNIVGQKIVQGMLSVRNLLTNYLDNVDLSDVVTSKTTNKITGIKSFDTVLIVGNLVSKNISTELLNGKKLNTIAKTALYLDEPKHISSMLFNNIIVGSLEAETINNVDLLSYTHYLDRVQEMNVINDLFVNGNVSIENAQHVVNINNYNINDILNRALVQEGGGPIRNSVRFLGIVNAENIEVTTVNNINFPKLVSRLFYRSWPQNISVPFTFDHIISSNLVAPKINDIPLANLINIKDDKPQSLLAWGGLRLTYPKFLKSLTAEKLLCDLNQAVRSLKSPPTRYWSFIRVSQNATFWDKTCDLSIIFHNAVNVGKSNVITGKVTIDNDFSASDITSYNLINGININELFDDAVLNNMEGQVIRGHKTFASLSVASAIVDVNADIPIVNYIEMEKLNQSIIYKSNVNAILIKGKKSFYNGFQANTLLTPIISNLDPRVLVNLKNLQVIPETLFGSLEVVNNLNIHSLNNISVDYIIEERMLCCTNHEQILEGTYYFDTATLVGDSVIPFLNKFATDNIIFNDKNVQEITGQKTFLRDLEILGDVRIGSLNGEDFSERHKQSVRLGETTNIKGNLELNAANLITTNIKTEYINGFSVRNIKEIMNSKIPVDKTKFVYEVGTKIRNIVDECANLSYAFHTRFLYFEKSTDLQVSIPNAISAHALNLKNNVVFHITQNEQDGYCGLPKDCTCRTQNNIQISEERSINSIAEIGTSRVFSYENENMTSHLLTNSVSYSDRCRLGSEIAQNETTSLIWAFHPSNNSHPSYFHDDFLTGFISGAEYFTSNDNIYMVVSRFYDPINGTSSLDCRVYKFNKEEPKVTLMQVIATEYSWTIHIFQTAHGIILIIGSHGFSRKSKIRSGAGVYRFHAPTERFIPMRKITKDITSATGMIVNTHSSIAISGDNTLEILKYHPEYDNYYSYQNIFFYSKITGVTTFYSGDLGIDDVYLCVGTEDGVFNIYSYQYIQGWKLVSKGEIEGLRLIVPFILNGKQYLFAVSTTHSFLLTAIIQGHK